MAGAICSSVRLLKSPAHSGGEAGIIVSIGDYVDKGPESRQVIERLLPGIAGGWPFIALKGNHDAMMVQGLREPTKLTRWLEKGGDAALASYGGDPAAVPQAHIAWLDGLRLTYADTHRLYVHAGVDPEVPLDRQSEETLLWKRYPKGYSLGFGDRHVVHGHDNRSRWPAAVRRPHQSGHGCLANGTACRWSF